ncbi:hypothetical protein SAMN05443579_106363 [Variovorax sp. PDC80]|uniref:hypothetical protein n=1 Tax=Variovorax sp. PDC80 TaxID=1882827 RepID=UPI0008E7BEA5|nr:hypothetical protein [Variovorax sp. PDC80]SFO82878.1 hypothetical protein SAMN05443579_106363 [Variovorax sp. PDC80]
MQDNRDAAFAAWVGAEDAAQAAIHVLHQRTRGGRMKVAPQEIEQIARLRKEADVRFAAVWGALGTTASAPEALPEPLPRVERPQRIVVGPRSAQGQALPSIAI